MMNQMATTPTTQGNTLINELVSKDLFSKKSRAAINSHTVPNRIAGKPSSNNTLRVLLRWIRECIPTYFIA